MGTLEDIAGSLRQIAEGALGGAQLAQNVSLAIFDFFRNLISLIAMVLPEVVKVLVLVISHPIEAFLFFEILLMGLAFMITTTKSQTRGNPLSFISNYVEVHVKLLVGTLNLVYNTIVALTTWIP